MASKADRGRKSIPTICEHWGLYRSVVGCKKKPLPPYIREAKTLASFKKSWKQFLVIYLCTILLVFLDSFCSFYFFFTKPD